ncbi:hypothetical protein ABVT39_015191 [Epinephelus coioides]
MATGFDLKNLLANPSYESFIRCRKDELVEIAAHFGRKHSKQILKVLVLSELVEHKLVMLPAQSEPSELLGTLGVEGSHEQEGAPPAREREKGVLAEQSSKTPFTLPNHSDTIDECFKSFTFDGLVSLACGPADKHPQSACGYDSVLRGVEMGYLLQPFHRYVQSELITGYFPVSVCPELPIGGIGFLMGNDIAGGAGGVKLTPVH